MTSGRYDVAIELATAADDVDVAALVAMIEAVLAEEATEAGSALTVVLAGDEVLRGLNREHRDADEATDVLSFPADEGDAFPEAADAAGEPRYLGDIAVSLDTVRRQADDLGLAFELELRHVILHGTLHLLGFDHATPGDEAAMRAREEVVLGATVHAGERAHDD
ncbi:MAG: rRNA maturation RNase YbeY [Dehalococcoidia bacterium]